MDFDGTQACLQDFEVEIAALMNENSNAWVNFKRNLMELDEGASSDISR